jgi:hypothetical protein
MDQRAKFQTPPPPRGEVEPLERVSVEAVRVGGSSVLVVNGA